MCHLRHRLRIFLFRWKIMFCSQDIQAFAFLTISWFTKSVMSWEVFSTWDRVHLWICLLNHNSQSHQTWPNDRYKQGREFSGIFWRIWRTGARSQVIFQFRNLLLLLNNQLCQDSSVSSFWKGEYGTIKNGKCQPLKIARSCYIAILIKS